LRLNPLTLHSWDHDIRSGSVGRAGLEPATKGL
jgi:hypothetical protein